MNPDRTGIRLLHLEMHPPNMNPLNFPLERRNKIFGSDLFVNNMTEDHEGLIKQLKVKSIKIERQQQLINNLYEELRKANDSKTSLNATIDSLKNLVESLELQIKTLQGAEPKHAQTHFDQKPQNYQPHQKSNADTNNPEMRRTTQRLQANGESLQASTNTVSNLSSALKHRSNDDITKSGSNYSKGMQSQFSSSYYAEQQPKSSTSQTERLTIQVPVLQTTECQKPYYQLSRGNNEKQTGHNMTFLPSKPDTKTYRSNHEELVSPLMALSADCSIQFGNSKVLDFPDLDPKELIDSQTYFYR